MAYIEADEREGAPGVLRRRTLVAGAAWSVPAVLAAAPAAHAAISKCEVVGSLQIGPHQIVDVDAVCVANSQNGGLNVPRIRNDYGRAWLPSYIEICNCEYDDAWYRFREVDTLSNFQIEVDGRHNDQNSPTEGYRPPFKLNSFGEEGGCQIFTLTYRTSTSRPYNTNNSAPGPNSNYHSVTITINLQRNTAIAEPGQNHPGWTNVQTFVVTGGKVWRRIRNSWNEGDPINFNSCSYQSGGVSAASTGSGPVLRQTTTETTTQTVEPPSDPTLD